MTNVHGYDLHSIPIVFHYSVGFDIAYPRMEAMRRPKGRDKQDCLYPRSFRCIKRKKNTMAIVNVVRYENNKDEIVGKYAENDIRLGSQLIVYPSQTAFFVRGGTILDAFESGTYTIDSNNIPLLNKVINLPFGSDSPFGAEVWFVNQTSILDCKWGTAVPLQIEDPKYGIVVPVKAFGQYGFRISNPRLFLESFVGNMPSFATELMTNYFRGVIQSKLSTVITQVMLSADASIVNIGSKADELSSIAQGLLSPAFENYGVQLLLFNVMAVSVSEEDVSFQRLKQAIDASAEMQILGQGNYQMRRSFDVLEKAAENTGGGTMNAAVGLGAGLNIGNQMGNLAASTINTPPPLPQMQWHLAVNGVQQGVYDTASLLLMLSQGKINTNSLVWKAGMPQWLPISQVSELNTPNNETPPPLPKTSEQ